MNLAELRKFVEAEIDSYVYEVPEGAIGNRMSDEWVQTQLIEAKESVVEPYVEKMWLQDTYEQIKDKDNKIIQELLVVADDKKDFIVFYDQENKEFGLANSTCSEIKVTIGVRGDFIGCFMAR